MKKDNYFGGVKINIVRKSNRSLVVSDAFGESELTVSDGEIQDRNDSAPVAVITIAENGKEKTFFVHKMDLLALSTFLLNIHNEYANAQNEIRLKKHQEMLNLNNSGTVALSKSEKQEMTSSESSS